MPESLPDADRPSPATASASPPGTADFVSQASSVADGKTPLAAATGAPSPGNQLGGYTVLKKHAQGGLGIVSLARDETLGRDVALKEIRPDRRGDPNLRQRFLTEAAITGRLEHPGIVPIYQLAQKDGEPYYAMRFIQGKTLADAIREFHYPSRDRKGAVEHATPLADARDSVSFDSFEFRPLLQRFVAVCNTIAYAHSKSVIHRDLKPANVMLGDYGETLVVDWGLAKTGVRDQESVVSGKEESGGEREQGTTDNEQLTSAGQVLGTPAYMSPEQAEGAGVGPATDVYALGAILYELLTGRPPYSGRSGLEVLAQVKAGPPPAPSQVLKKVPRALEGICRQAMARSSADRYVTATALAQDVDRFLADERVLAHSEPWPVRARRWMRKHRPLVTGAAAAVLVAMVGLTVGLIIVAGLNRRLDAANSDLVQTNVQLETARQVADARREEAEKNHKRAEVTLSYFTRVFGRPDPALDGEKVTVASVLRDSSKALAKEDSLEPRTRARLLNAIGMTYLGLGLHNDAIPVLEQACRLHTEDLGQDHVDTLGCMNNLASAYVLAGKSASALPLQEETVKLMKAKLGTNHPDTLQSMANLAAVYQKADRLTEALQMYEQTLKLMKPDHPKRLQAMNNLASAYLDLKRPDDARPLLEETLKLMKATLGPDHPNTLSSMGNLASAYRSAGRLAEALKLGEEVLELERAKMGPDHPNTLTSATNLAGMYRDAGRLTEALPLEEEIVKVIERKLGSDHPKTLEHMNNLATVYLEAGRSADATRVFEKTLKLTRLSWVPLIPRRLCQ